MSLEEFKKMDASQFPIGKLISMISRAQEIYLNHQLKNLDINSTQLMLLFEISHQNNLNQEKIASRCNFNKGAVARSIRKLEEKELIIREIDEKNRRQNKISLTPKGEEIIKKGIDVLNIWEDEVFNDYLIDEITLKKVLKDIAVRTIEMNEENRNE
ncbi:MarR family transcriptional regulator [Methanobrevibacter sp.]|uniref:MarR family winged helix-turn-helix transcriptional regulator n=1 Tax=Methanobrevibacter sp. TaxID=66852 RepID=UPI0025EA13B2|nr:MarR family transcriptional regulator [Methanobrevibacter sp.]MEE0938902.1 MarR family transcriptional regulator [Methanobrevibacter sp.]